MRNTAIQIGMKKVTCMGVIVLWMLSIQLNAQATIPLHQAITNGLANKKKNLAGKQDIALSHLQTQALYRKYYPQVSAEYQYLYNPILQTSILPIGVFNPSYPIDATKSVQFGTKWTQTAGVTATLPLLDLSIKRHINEAKLQERIAAVTQEQSEYELAYTIAQTYVDVLLQESRITSLIADTSRTSISYTLLKHKFDEKRLLKSDLNTSKINHTNSLQQLTDGIALLIEHKVYLLYLMGFSDMEKWDFEVDTAVFTQFSTSEVVTTMQLNHLPDINQLSLQSELSSMQTASEGAKQLPTLGFKGFIGANQFSNDFNPVAANSWFGSSYVGLDIKIPLLFGENTSNKKQQLLMQSNQYMLQKEDKSLQYTKDVVTSKLKMENVKSQLITQKENIVLSKETIAIYQARVEEGQENAFNLNIEEAKLQVLTANYEVNQRQLMAYWLDYLKSSGQLSTLWK